jgi:hypothetical protein
MRRVLAKVLVGAVVASGAWLVAAQPTAEGKLARPHKARPAALPVAAEVAGEPHGDKLMGVASCASTSCHNVNGPRGSPRSEYSTWAGYDKHARAFQVLYDDRSTRIARNLYGDKAKAWELQVCLNCHSSRHAAAAGTDDRFALEDGVGCESCHGAAERYLTAHYQAGFKQKSLQEKWDKYGLRPTKDLVQRALICADCHIGNPAKGMEVNHDLIAAGHPRLNFENAGYLHMYARHWPMHGTADNPGDKDRYPDYEARAWAIGQVASARAAIEQVVQRAEGAGKAADKGGKPWPEFAEYGCFACHKDLRVIPTEKVAFDRYEARYKDRTPGSLPWGTWYLPLTQTYAKLSGINLDEPGTSVTKLKELMERPGSPPAAVAAHGRKTLQVLDGWLDKINRGDPMTADQIGKLLKALAAEGEKRALALDWDQTAQFYLALAALNDGLKDLDPNHPAAALRKDIRSIGLRLKRAFQPGFDSPRAFDPEARPLLDAQFKAVREQLGN